MQFGQTFRLSSISFALVAALAAGLVAVGCGDSSGMEDSAPGASTIGTAESGLTSGSSPLWVGLPSVTIERFPSDPCNNGSTTLDDSPVVYESWARQRASVRNACFEVWSPGITDWDNPDFWKQLDVQAHSRYLAEEGPVRSEYVNSIDRRGNNRRYAWSIGSFARDPFHAASSVLDVTVPFEVESETDTSFDVAATLEFHFTVNDDVLAAPSGAPFQVRYTRTVSKQRLGGEPADHILYPSYTCDDGALRVGSGPGYFAAVVRSPGEVSLFAPASGIEYGVPTSAAPDADGPAFSVAFWASHASDGEALIAYADTFSGTSHATLRPEGDTATLSLRGYDRALGKVRDVSATFSSCAPE